MGTTAEKLEYTSDTKAAIRLAIIAKGVIVPEDATFRSYATYIGQISGGGGGTEEIDNLIALINGYPTTSTLVDLTSILTVKNGIKASIRNKGITVDDADYFNTYPAKIDSIPSGNPDLDNVYEIALPDDMPTSRTNLALANALIVISNNSSKPGIWKLDYTTKQFSKIHETFYGLSVGAVTVNGDYVFTSTTSAFYGVWIYRAFDDSITNLVPGCTAKYAYIYHTTNGKILFGADTNTTGTTTYGAVRLYIPASGGVAESCTAIYTTSSRYWGVFHEAPNGNVVISNASSSSYGILTFVDATNTCTKTSISTYRLSKHVIASDNMLLYNTDYTSGLIAYNWATDTFVTQYSSGYTVSGVYQFEDGTTVFVPASSSTYLVSYVPGTGFTQFVTGFYNAGMNYVFQSTNQVAFCSDYTTTARLGIWLYDKATNTCSRVVTTGSAYSVGRVLGNGDILVSSSSSTASYAGLWLLRGGTATKILAAGYSYSAFIPINDNECLIGSGNVAITYHLDSTTQTLTEVSTTYTALSAYCKPDANTLIIWKGTTLFATWDNTNKTFVDIPTATKRAWNFVGYDSYRNAIFTYDAYRMVYVLATGECTQTTGMQTYNFTGTVLNTGGRLIWYNNRGTAYLAKYAEAVDANTPGTFSDIPAITYIYKLYTKGTKIFMASDSNTGAGYLETTDDTFTVLHPNGDNMLDNIVGSNFSYSNNSTAQPCLDFNNAVAVGRGFPLDGYDDYVLARNYIQRVSTGKKKDLLYLYATWYDRIARAGIIYANTDYSYVICFVT